MIEGGRRSVFWSVPIETFRYPEGHAASGTDGVSEGMTMDHQLFGVERIRDALPARSAGQVLLDAVNAA